PDEVVSPDKLDSLLMMIDEMGIKLIDETDVADFNKPEKPVTKTVKSTAALVAPSVKSTSSSTAAAPAAPPTGEPNPDEPVLEEEEEEIDLNLEAELAEASTKRIDDPVRMYLTQMGEIPLLTREQEIALAKKIE